MNAVKEQFGARLRLARRRMDWSQDDLQLASGIGKPRISRYENGHVGPSVQTVKVLADILGVDPAWLVGWKR